MESSPPAVSGEVMRARIPYEVFLLWDVDLFFRILRVLFITSVYWDIRARFDC